MNLTNDRKYAIAMLIFSMVYCFSAFSLDADFNPTQEKYYPFVLSIAMIILSLALLVWPSPHTTTWPKRKNLQKIGLTFCAILVYSLVLHRVGFLISASILMGICMWVFEANRKWIVPVSIIVAISFYLIFDRLLGLTLPAGILNFF
ncbi:MAG: tripartite tricarboxylate transporter TctB family protein [Desulfobacula sp.]|uniref:tripartite tricarboxylate transporter TctB family protein n=1 Tax=Desulfobacula sp. TaxID=2593537 RepID=UPI0025B81351|nr:tripartite tricarboxylate transporter TctB family protein [Desulfobacula sp.]MCD4720529.1 tripartite tricarboxylate transporter TctB family protein [Desulfobacula sp.]